MSESAYSLKESIRQLPRNVRESVSRRGEGTPEQERAAAVFGNLFLHLHPVRVHTNSLRAGYTFGLGLISFFLFLILTASGVLLTGAGWELRFLTWPSLQGEAAESEIEAPSGRSRRRGYGTSLRGASPRGRGEPALCRRRRERPGRMAEAPGPLTSGCRAGRSGTCSGSDRPSSGNRAGGGAVQRASAARAGCGGPSCAS